MASSSELTRPNMELIQAIKSLWSFKNRCRSYESNNFSFLLFALAVNWVHSSLISVCLAIVCSADSGWLWTSLLAVSSSCFIYDGQKFKFPLKDIIKIRTLSPRAARSLSKPSCFLCKACTLLRSLPRSSLFNASSFSWIQSLVSSTSLWNLWTS